MMKAVPEDADLFMDMFGEALADTEMTPDELEALGVDLPQIDTISIECFWLVEGDHLTLTMDQILIHVEGEALGIDSFFIRLIGALAT